MSRAGNKDSKIKAKKIGVLAGGPSSERDISLKSGEAVYEALRKMGLDCAFIDIRDIADVEKLITGAKVEAVFIVLHGGFGEDGTIQKILSELEIPYTGSGPEASNLALDKIASRRLFQKVGITVPEYKIITKGEKLASQDVYMPCVIKPQREGSSVGLSTVLNAENLDKALEEAFFYGDKVIIEKFIKGRELTVGILDDEPLPVVEIIPENGCYDYHAKYESPNTQYLVPAPVKQKHFRKAQRAGLMAYKALGCRSFSRVDMILGDDGALYVLEVNTIPGLTSRSLLPKAAKEAGIDFSQLCEKILEGASL